MYYRKKPEIVTYTEMVATNKTYIRGLTIVLYRKKPEIVATNKTYIRGLTIVL